MIFNYRLAGCNITQTGFDILVSALRSILSHLKELDLSFNRLQKSQVDQLSALLESEECRLQILRSINQVFYLCGSLLEHQQQFVKSVFLCRLSGCGVTEEGCSSLATALTSKPSHLKQLDLKFSHLGGSGLKKLSAALETLK